MSIPIHPETRVGELLDAYPGIDEALIRWVPAFAKLRNPILRKTVAKVATLEQAARVGGVGVRELVQKLREETGQSPVDLEVRPVTAPEPAERCGHSCNVRERIDADAMLEAGTHPLGRVRQAAAELSNGEALLLTSSFRPAPLLDVLSSAGFAIHCSETSAGRFETLIRRT